MRDHGQPRLDIFLDYANDFRYNEGAGKPVRGKNLPPFLFFTFD
jgi:hypothetical protein